jgi:hypothetical protein
VFLKTERRSRTSYSKKSNANVVPVAYKAHIYTFFLVVRNDRIVKAHLSIWTKSMYGADPKNGNSNRAALPLQGYPFNQWWWHGNLDEPPPPGEVFNLPANGKADVEIAGNKAFTSMGKGLRPNPREAPVPWSNTGNGWGSKYRSSFFALL